VDQVYGSFIPSSYPTTVIVGDIRGDGGIGQGYYAVALDKDARTSNNSGAMVPIDSAAVEGNFAPLDTQTTTSICYNVSWANYTII
jgi:hypothetical protein